jgi:ABC-2 type transport system permease protein
MKIPEKGWMAVIVRELKRMTSKRLYVMMTLVLPLIGFGLFVAIFYQGKPTDLPIAIVDNDRSSLSRSLVETIDLTQTVEVQTYVADLHEARTRLQKCDYYAVVIIPQDFSKNIYRNQQPNVVCYYNNAFMLIGSLINSDVSTAVRTFSSGINYSTRVKKGQPQAHAKVAVNPIAVDGHKLFNPYLNYFYYLATTFLPIILLIFVLMGTVYAIGVEYKNGTAQEWLDTANGSILRAMTGKLLPYALIWFLLLLFINVLTFKFFGMPLNGSVGVLFFNGLLFVMAYMACGVFISAVFPALRMGLSVASIYSALAFTFSGLTFPYIAMYSGVAFLGNFFPFSHYLNVFVDQTLRAATPELSFIPLVYLVTFCMLPFTVLMKHKKMCKNSRYWGKL